MNENILGKRIKYLRERKDISQIDLAKYLNIGNTTLSQYESGKRIPSDQIKLKIANYFNVSVDFLLGNTDNPSPISETEPSIDEEIAQIMKDLGPDVTLQFYDLKGMSDEEKEDLKLFLQLLKAKREKKGENN